MTATWTNSTTFELLTANQLQVGARTTFSETHARGIAVNDADVLRLTRHRGNDLVDVITRALADFDHQLRRLNE